MGALVKLYSNKNGEISSFLNRFLKTSIYLENPLEWIKEYKNPIEMADIIAAFIDNNEDYEIGMWISLDEGFFLHVDDDNVDDIIRYFYERYPY